MPRLFTGIEIPRHIGEHLSLLRGGLPGARWIDPDNYHITLRFIGDIDGRTADMIAESLDDILLPSFDLQLSGIGSFGTKKPHSVWTGVEAPDTLTQLHKWHERLAHTIGLEPEGRKFRPHVTLARMKQYASSRDDLARYIANNNLFRTQRFTVDRFVLFSSRESTGGGPYVVEAEYPLH